MSQFIFILKNEKTASYKKSILAIIGLVVLFFLYLAFSTDDNQIKNFSLIATGFITLSFGLQYFLKKSNKEFSAVFTSIGFVIFVFITWQLWWQAFAMIIILLFYFWSIRTPKVYISKEAIIFPSLPAKHIKWESLNNLLLKDNLLTIDFKNNKLIQAELISGQKEGIINEKIFNDFCKQQLNQ